MKLSVIHNDRQTAKDELILFLVVVICLAAGVLLAVFRPAFWIVSARVTSLVGVLLILLGVMYIPCLIYRLVTNDRKK